MINLIKPSFTIFFIVNNYNQLYEK